MNVKKMVKTAAIAAILGTGFVPSAYADVSVEDVKCTQRYPWNGLVDIEYTIACDDPEAEIYVNPVGFNGDTGLTVFPTHFTGDGATNTVKAGKHTMVWDAKADLGNTFATKNFQIKMYAGKKLSRYIVIDISGGTNATSYAVRHSIEGPNLADDTCRTTEIWMRLIPPGTFMMGSPEDELGRSNNEDLHLVTITKPYYMGVFEVTQRQWEQVMGDRPSNFNNNASYANHPVENVTYANVRHYTEESMSINPIDKNSFIGRIRTKTASVGFDLPTESKWEMACRAGCLTSLYDGNDITGLEGCHNLNNLGRYSVNGTSTSKVGQFKPNSLGLFDMLGNVREMCLGWKDNWNTSPIEDPECSFREISTSGTTDYYLTLKGGAWNQKSSKCRCASRERWDFYSRYTSSPYKAFRKNNNIGFRLCCTGNLQQ